MHRTPTAPVRTPRVSAGCTLRSQPKSVESRAQEERQPRDASLKVTGTRRLHVPRGDLEVPPTPDAREASAQWRVCGQIPAHTTPRGARRLLGPLSCNQEPPSGQGWASVTRGRMVSWWRIDVSQERESSLPFLLPGGVQLPLASCLPGALTHPEFWSICRQATAGRGLTRPNSPRVFLHLSGSAGTSLLPDATHCKRRGKAGFPGQALISPRVISRECWIQV